MSVKEVERANILGQVKSKKLNKTEAAQLLRVSRQHLDRLYKRFSAKGAMGLISQRRGKTSNNRIPDPVREAVVQIIKEQYPDFKPGFAHQKLVDVHGFQLSDETVRQLMIGAGIWQGKHRKVKRPHQMRERRPRFGELIQIDGSPHDWFEGRRPPCCLLVFIDDATSRLVGLRFVETECLEGYFELMMNYLSHEGRPLALYSDRHTLFHVPDKEATFGTGETQFGRAMRELDIELIPAYSPQAKGRVERANSTLQDRLVKEMRLLQINDIQTANTYLPAFIQDYNHRFAVPPQNPVNAHRKKLPSTKHLNLILSVQTQRKLSKNLELSYKNIIYQIQSKTPAYTLRGARVTVVEAQEQVTLLYKGKALPYKTFNKANRPKAAISGKELNPFFEKQVIKKYIPPSTHPWKRNYSQSPKIVNFEHLSTDPPKQSDSLLSTASEIYG